ncbi:unnamed protein product [Cunninghamella echinulata]
MRTCLTHIENIIESHTPGIPTKIQPQNTGDSQKFPKPPLPPKPSRIHKPVLPPKPTRNVPINSSSSSTTTNDEYLQDKSSEQSYPYQQPIDSASNITATNNINNIATTTNNNINSRPYSVPSPDSIQLQKHRPYTEIRQHDDIVIVSDSKVDPTHLVPAQTNVDSLTSSISGQSSSDNVPLIPTPPLLTTHRVLQAKLDDLEITLKEIRNRKQQLLKEHPTLDPMTEDDINHKILQYSRQVADTKQTLNRVRTIYMSAATIPSFMHFKAHVTAYQVTLIESSIFSAIPPTALLVHSAKQPHPRIVASTDFFNYFTRIIEHSILFPQEASERAQLIHYWIKVASRCLELNNYQTLKAIVSALGTPPVDRLRRTWAFIPKKSVTKLESLNELMSEADNYGRYREHMGMVSTTVINGKSVAQIRAEHFTKPTIPFLGTFIHDITYLLAVYKSSSSSPNNVYKTAEEEPRIKEILDTIRRFQHGPKYPMNLPGTYNKAHQKHHFRPSLTNALSRGASGIGRISSNGLFGFGGNNNNNNNNSNNNNGRDSSNGSSSSSSNSVFQGFGADDDDKDNDDSEDGNMEEQQEMVTQYLLMRPWVNQDTVDQLSILRETPRQKSNTSSSSSSSGQRNSSGHNSNNTNATSSMLRYSSNSGGEQSRPTSVDNDDHHHYRKSEELTRHSTSSGTSHHNTSSNFWPFRRSMDQSSSPNNNNNNNDLSSLPHGSVSYHPSPSSSSLLSTTTTTQTVGQAPIVPPRPTNIMKATTSVPQKQMHAPQNDEFKAVLAQRLAKVSTDTN